MRDGPRPRSRLTPGDGGRWRNARKRFRSPNRTPRAGDVAVKEIGPPIKDYVTKISGRNALEGEIKKVRKGATTAQVEIERRADGS
ncbi:CHAP domain-containing protein [Methylocapsa palsarum]|uniref:CHAP domain-containing protein n=1 Tax=Methylocapsa palsarum TaxID=1612308 RepID=UPI000B83CC50|nr:hypothetical protein [Methylocapsa palsarum]